MRNTRNTLGLIALAALGLTACDQLSGTDGGNNGNPDGGGNTETPCPGPLPSADITCTAAECSSTTGTKNFGEATLASSAGKSWIVPVWATSEVLNDNTTIDYSTMTSGALSARDEARRAAAHERARAFMGEEAYAQVFSPERVARVRAESRIRAAQYRGPIALETLRGTAIRGRTEDILPKGVHRQATACSASAPSCGASMLCVIPEGQTDGTCEGSVLLKFATGGTNFDHVTASVKKVGTFGAVLTDDADPAVSDADISAIVDRFDTHIAPLDHAFFGEPRTAQGQDRDGNGVTIFLLTKRVATRTPEGAALVGYFQSTDLLDTATDMTSNAADILYLQPPGAAITLDALSGTIAHEYQHLINYYQKKILRQSGPEDLWLDEGLSGFAEDMTGYGADAFDNIFAYMAMFDQVSLTGQGNTASEDSNERRGMAHLLVRYLFEQAGGATFNSPGSASGGGVAAVKKLVQSADTGTLLFTTQNTGRSFSTWVGDLITTAAIDGAGFDGVSCNPAYSLRAPETDSFTNYQRGIDLRGSFTSANGTRRNLTGPVTATLGNDTGVPIPANGGEIRTIDVASGSVKMSITGSVDYEVGFRPLPTAK